MPSIIKALSWKVIDVASVALVYHKSFSHLAGVTELYVYKAAANPHMHVIAKAIGCNSVAARES